LGGRVLDHVGLALPVLKLGLSRRRAVRNLRQPRVEARDRIVQLPRDTRLAADGVAAGRIMERCRTGDLLDLTGDGVQPLVNVGDIRVLLARRPLIRRRTKLRRRESPRVELSQSLSDMPARRAAASALSRTNGSMPSTLHDTREFMLSSGSDSGAHLRLQPPRASQRRDNRIPRGSSASGTDFSCYGK
jgi:hypothetical protein